MLRFIPIVYMASAESITLGIIITTWFIFYLLAKRLKLEDKGWEIAPYYALYKSTKLNELIKKLASLSPRFWKILGNIGIAASIGQVLFISYILTRNLWNFIFVPDQASPVQPLIPGVTISVNSLPWFLLAAGIIILTHELGHGIMCIIEDIPVKNSALMLAVVTFGGAVEPDEEAMEEAGIMTKMRIFAIGSIINLITGILTIPLFIAFGRIMPVQIAIFLQWVYFIAVNLAMMNMLPIGPLDGGQMWRTFTQRYNNGETLQRVATYGFITLILMNIGLSLSQFGFVPI
jgi:Zn-dependent protease